LLREDGVLPAPGCLHGFTRDRTPPTTPTNLRVTSLSHKSITLAWDPSTDNSGSFSYSVNKDGQNFTVPQTLTTYTID